MTINSKLFELTLHKKKRSKNLIITKLIELTLDKI